MADKGNYRSTRVVMFDSDKYQSLAPNEKLVLLTMKHGSLSNIAGIFTFRSGQIGTLSDQTGLSIRAIEGALKGLRRACWIVQSAGALWIRNQLKHDPHINFRSKNHLMGIINVLNKIPRDPLVDKFVAYYDIEGSIDALPEGLAEPIRRAFEGLAKGLRSTDTETETETETDTETETEAPAAKTSEPPINRFNAWLKTEKGKSTFWTLSQQYSLPDGIVLEELANMRAWLIAKPKQGNKKEWPAFLNNWFKGCRRDMIQPTNPMTAEEEQKHYESKRRDRGGDPVAIGDILDGVTENE